MPPIALLLFKSLVVSGVMLAYYMLALRGKKLHRFNRFYLLATVTASLVVPFLRLDWFTITETAPGPAFQMLQVAGHSTAEDAVAPHATSQLSGSSIIYMLCAFVSLGMLALTAGKIAWLYGLKRKHKVTRMQGYNIIHTSLSKAPFSFLNDLYWKDTIDPDNEAGQLVLQHELAHIRQHHSIDKLLLQAVLIVCWINPFFWLIQKELSIVHEFLADEKAIKDNDTASFATMLLESHYKSALPVIVNPFYSSTKRRIIMLSQTNKIRYATARKLMVLPLLLATVALFSFSSGSRKTEVHKAKNKLVLVLDAGHGGNDAGGVSKTGISEKDMNLKICNRLSQLAADYNIEVVPTREGDQYPTLNQRAEKGNRLANGVFISIHMQKDREGATVQSRQEVIVSGMNPRFTESKMLASAVIGQLQAFGSAPVLTEQGPLVVLKNNKLPAIVIECGNIDNPDDVAIVNYNERLDAMCRSILGGVVAYANTTSRTSK